MTLPLINTSTTANAPVISRETTRSAPPARSAGGIDASLAPQPAFSPTPTSAPATREADAAQVQEAVEQINNAVKEKRNDVEFAIDDDSGRVVVKLIDRQTQEILKQFPSEEVLQMSKALGETIKKLGSLKGLIVEDKA